jgi:hypothetical protein
LAEPVGIDWLNSDELIVCNTNQSEMIVINAKSGQSSKFLLQFPQNPNERILNIDQANVIAFPPIRIDKAMKVKGVLQFSGLSDEAPNQFHFVVPSTKMQVEYSRKGEKILPKEGLEFSIEEAEGESTSGVGGDCLFLFWRDLCGARHSVPNSSGTVIRANNWNNFEGVRHRC